MAAVTALVLLGGCGASGGSHSKSSDSKLVVALDDFANDLSLPWLMSNKDAQVWGQVYNTLILEKPGTATPIPGLATSWSSNSNDTAWTFKLRHGVQFQGGWGEFTSADVKFTLDQDFSPKSTGTAAAFVRQNVKSIETPDKYTVVLNMKTPSWQVPSAMTENQAIQFIVSKKYVEKVGMQKAAAHPIGTGPYEYVSGQTQSEHTFKAFPDYWGPKPHFANLVLRLVKNSETALNAIKTGDADIAPLQSGDQVKQASNEGIKLISNPQGTMAWVNLPGLTGAGTPDFCPSCPWVGDPSKPTSLKNAALVRQALALAIDKKALVDVAFGHGSTRSMGYMYFPYMPGFSDQDWPLPGYDVNKAKQLLAQAGHPGGGFTIKIWVYSDVTKAATQIIAQDWKAIGVTLKQDVTDTGTLQAANRARKTRLHGQVYIAAGGPPESSVLLASASTTSGALCFLACNKDLDKKIFTTLGTIDKTKRVALEQQLQTELYKEQYGISLGWDNPTWAVSGKVHKWSFAPGYKYTVGFQYIS